MVQISPTYRSPYTQQLGASLERQLTKTTTLTGTYLHSFGVHQMVTRDANPYAPVPGTTYYNSTTGPRLNPSLGIINEYYPKRFSKQNQMILNVNAAHLAEVRRLRLLQPLVCRYGQCRR